jgi:hypothetical protein
MARPPAPPPPDPPDGVVQPASASAAAVVAETLRNSRREILDRVTMSFSFGIKSDEVIAGRPRKPRLSTCESARFWIRDAASLT